MMGVMIDALKALRYLVIFSILSTKNNRNDIQLDFKFNPLFSSLDIITIFFFKSKKTYTSLITSTHFYFIFKLRLEMTSGFRTYIHWGYTRIATGVSFPGEALGQKSFHNLVEESKTHDHCD